VECIAKAGTLGIIGVYPPGGGELPDRQGDEQEPVDQRGQLQPPRLHPEAGIPKLVEMVRVGVIDPVKVLTKVQPLTDAIEAYEHFDKREVGWIKTELKLAAAAE